MTPSMQALPELGDDRVAVLERELFARIADEPRSAPTAVSRRAARGRVWLGALGGAAAVVVALVVAPAIVTSVTRGTAVDESGGGTSVSGSAGSAVAPVPADGSGFTSTDVAAAPSGTALNQQEIFEQQGN